MADNDQLLHELKSINKRLSGLEQGQQEQGKDIKTLREGQARLEHGQQEQGKQLDTLLQGQAHIDSVLKVVATKQDIERLEDGQDELQAILHTREAKLVKKVKEHEDRIAELEKHTGLTNPHKN